jgi:peptidyl-prolyl cis-trans isomerase D
MAVIGKIRNQAGLIIGLIGLSLVAFILGDLLKSNSSFLQGSGTDVAVIAGEKISIQEFEQSVQQMTDTYKQNSNVETVDQATSDMLREQAWNQLLREKIMNREFDKMNITVSPEELFQMTTGKDPHPSVKQAFTDPKTGRFDPANVIKFLKEKDKDPSGKTNERWIAFEKAIMMERISQKYNSLVKQGLYVTTAQAKEDYIEKGRMAKMQYVLLNYASIPDSTIKLSDSELNAYYKEHEQEHKQEASRKIEYITFDVAPSDEDRKAILDRISKQVAELKDTKDDSLYVRLNSDNAAADNSYHKKGTLTLALDTVFFKAAVGTVVGPYLESNEYKISKLVDIRMIPDSAKARHILLKINGDDKPKMLTKADSLKKVILAGGKFDELAKKFSEDPGSAIKGGDLGWFKDGMMVKPFNDACLSGKKGDLVVVESQFGIHLIQVLDLGVPARKVKVATASRKLEPSTKTSRAAFANANEFAGKNRTGEAFEKAVSDQKLNKRIADNVKENDRTIPGLENPRELIRWAYKSKKGEISPKVFELGDKYVVAHLADIREKGFATLEQIKDEMEAGAKKERKATQLIEKFNENLNGVSTVDALAAKLKTTAQMAENVSFALPNIPSVGKEAQVVGTAFTLKQGSISKPVKGNAGVFVVQMTQITEPPAVKDYKAPQAQALTNIKNRADYELFNALKDKAKVEDNRGRFY